MPETSNPPGLAPIILGLLALATVVGLLWFVFRRMTRRLAGRYVSGVLAHDAASASEAQMLELELSIGGQLPQLLRDVYLDGTITRILLPIKFFHEDMNWNIQGFFAADAVRNPSIARWCGLASNAFVFAGDDAGNFYFIKGGCDAVFYRDHRRGKVIEVFASFQGLWRRMKYCE